MRARRGLACYRAAVAVGVMALAWITVMPATGLGNLVGGYCTAGQWCNHTDNPLCIDNGGGACNIRYTDCSGMSGTGLCTLAGNNGCSTNPSCRVVLFCICPGAGSGS